MAPEHAVRVTDRLRGLAKTYAGRVAKMWPAPHAGYLALPVQRRHLAHMYVARVDRAPGLDARAFARDVSKARLQEFLRRWAPDAPMGLPAAANTMGDVAWAPADYRALIGVMAGCPRANKLIRHANAVTPDLVRVVEALPASLREPGVVRHIDQRTQADLVAQAVALVRRLKGGALNERALAERLVRAQHRKAFYDMVVASLRPERLPEPFAETERLRPLLTPGEVEEAGRRFQNCLATCVDRATFGRSAFVEWRGAEPAVMELDYEGAGGWRLAELLVRRNQEPTRATRRAVHAALAEVGVRTGNSAACLVYELQCVGDGTA